jgi:Flp pilus assembly protein TadG
MRKRTHTTAGHTRRRALGQALVEFALVIPIFITLVVAIAEFAFLFASFLSVSFASRDGVQMAAELGNAPCADYVVVDRIERDVTAPVDKAKITGIDIFWSDGAGNVKGGAVNNWVRGGSSSCTLPDTTTITVPYHQTSNGYPLASRCNIVSAADCVSGHTTIDTIGVKITYQYSWITPLPSLLGGSGTGMQMVQSNMMRLEPVK